MAALHNDWDCYGATLRESEASREGKALCSSCLTTRQRAAAEKRLFAVDERDSISTVSSVKETKNEKAPVSCESAHMRML